MRAPPRWPLAAVLTVAAGRERAARIALGDALAEAARRRSGEEAAREALRAHRAATADLARRGGPSPGARAADLAGLALLATRRAADEGRLAAAVARREAEHGAALDEAERRRRALGEARAAVRALEARRQCWQAARARDAARAEADASDDVVSARWGAGS